MDPLRTNKKEINVLHLMAKRNQVEMARRCLEAVQEDKARAISLVNNSSNIGGRCLISAREPPHEFQTFPQVGLC